MGQKNIVRYEFGPYIVEPTERRISGVDASRVELTAKAFDLLVLLVSRSGQLVTKDEILDALWQDLNIAESNVTTTISMIRKALREDSENRYIETVPEKGYRFVAPVRFCRDAGIPEEESTDTASPVISQRRTLAIAPFVIVALGVGLWFWHSAHAKSSESIFRGRGSAGSRG